MRTCRQGRYYARLAPAASQREMAVCTSPERHHPQQVQHALRALLRRASQQPETSSAPGQQLACTGAHKQSASESIRDVWLAQNDARGMLACVRGMSLHARAPKQASCRCARGNAGSSGECAAARARAAHMHQLVRLFDPEP